MTSPWPDCWAGGRGLVIGSGSHISALSQVSRLTERQDNDPINSRMIPLSWHTIDHPSTRFERDFNVPLTFRIYGILENGKTSKGWLWQVTIKWVARLNGEFGNWKSLLTTIYKGSSQLNIEYCFGIRNIMGGWRSSVVYMVLTSLGRNKLKSTSFVVTSWYFAPWISGAVFVILLIQKLSL